jgi:myosin heavy subunit
MRCTLHPPSLASQTRSPGGPTGFKKGVGGFVSPGDTENLTDLENLTEETLLLELAVRYKKNAIYTYVGDILCAINPFKAVPGMYDDSQQAIYTGLSDLSVLPPHIFALADSAFSAMQGGGSTGNANQVCVISGESGAGKTESAKVFIKHIIHLSQT